MDNKKNINIEDFDYNLDSEKIAYYPVNKRDESKLLIYENGNITDSVFKNIKNFLPKGSLLVFNDSKVVNARLKFFKNTGAKIEIFCLEPEGGTDYTQAFSANDECCWNAFVGNNKKWKDEVLSQSVDINGIQIILNAEKLADHGEHFTVKFFWDNSNITFAEILESFGDVPLPPYIKRNAEKVDENRYRTVYGKVEGSVAAPTAGLHFTNEMIYNLKKNSHKAAYVSLHVGAGTFSPVKTDNAAEHTMHAEKFSVSIDNLKLIFDNLKNIVVVGTTSLRTLESLYCIGVQILSNRHEGDDNFFVGQWEAYESKHSISAEQSIAAVIQLMEKNKLAQLNCTTQIMIIPGYDFKISDSLITNFHQPKSTLLLLVSAFTDNNWRKIYDHATKNNYRFLSYGDSMIIKK